MRLLLGVDGGGTKTRATLAQFSGNEFEVISQGRSGPANVVTDGIATATENIRDSIRMAFSLIGTEPMIVESACFAIAGSERESVRQPLSDWIENANFAARYTLVNDAEPILFGASRFGHGIAVISGTGSLAYGRDPTGKTARAGGWGPLTSDEGSGYWIAIEGLKEVMRAFDGRAPTTELTELIQRTLDVRTVAEIPRAVSQLDRSQISQLAKCVSVAADHSDGAARNVLQAAGRELAELAQCVIEQLATPVEWHIATSGSVLLNSPIVYHSFESQLRNRSNVPPPKISRIADCTTGLLTIAHRELTM
jgi:N-acetylglucosamine kinase-like BadF-type ATPase